MTALACATALTGCGSDRTTSNADQATEPAPGQSSSHSSGTVEPGKTEPITIEGVAALVSEHLGAANIDRFGTFGADDQEEGTVGVAVWLRGDDPRTMFVVNAMAPDAEEGGGFGEMAGFTCEEQQRHTMRGVKDTWCEDVQGGGTVAVQLIEYGFSDDNRHGQVLSGLAVEADGRVAMALYETYTNHVTVDPQNLLKLLADERLAWQTDPAVNQAGRGIDVETMAG